MLDSLKEKTLRLVLKPEERIDITGPVTIIANRKADLIFKGTGNVGRRYFEEDKE